MAVKDYKKKRKHKDLEIKIENKRGTLKCFLCQ